MYERPAAETPERSPRAELIASLKFLPLKLLVGVILVAAITLVARPLLEEWAVSALGLGTMFMVGFVDWRRWREIHWKPLAVFAVLAYGASFVVWYLFPQ